MHKSVAAMSQQGRSSYMSFLALDDDHEPGIEMLYAPGTLRHVTSALKAGATMEEIMEVLKRCIVQGAQAYHLGAPILAEELAAVSKAIAP
jgi:alkylhydroperoxidase/carboxymuconolactone decarboxylase family protein YurZ